MTTARRAYFIALAEAKEQAKMENQLALQDCAFSSPIPTQLGNLREVSGAAALYALTPPR